MTLIFLKSLAFFQNAVSSLNVKPDEYYLSDMKNLREPINIAIRKFENLSSVQDFKQDFKISFRSVFDVYATYSLCE